MSVKKIAATSLFAIAATGIAAGTANAAPAPAAPMSIRGIDRGVVYTSTLSKDHSGVTTNLQSGHFSLAPDASTVNVTAPNGRVIDKLPTSVMASGHEIRLAPSINSDGTSLTLRPTGTTGAVQDVRAFNNSVPRAESIGQVKEIGLLASVSGAVVGAVIGAVIGALIGALFLIVGAIPGLLVGAVVGALVGAIAGCIVI